MLKRIEEDFKLAMKNKDEIRLSALRNLKSEIKNAEIQKGAALNDEEIVSVVSKKVKQHKDSIESFNAGGRTDLVEHEQKQMEVLAAYLPEQLSEDEVRKVVEQTARGAAPGDFGRVMKEVMAKLKGKTDGSVVSRIVKETLK